MAEHADKLAITGSPNLTGSNIAFQASSLDQGKYVILTSTGTLTGTFAGTASHQTSVTDNEVDHLLFHTTNRRSPPG